MFQKGPHSKDISAHVDTMHPLSDLHQRMVMLNQSFKRTWVCSSQEPSLLKQWKSKKTTVASTDSSTTDIEAMAQGRQMRRLVRLHIQRHWVVGSRISLIWLTSESLWVTQKVVFFWKYWASLNIHLIQQWNMPSTLPFVSLLLTPACAQRESRWSATVWKKCQEVFLATLSVAECFAASCGTTLESHSLITYVNL